MILQLLLTFAAWLAVGFVVAFMLGKASDLGAQMDAAGKTGAHSGGAEDRHFFRHFRHRISS